MTKFIRQARLPRGVFTKSLDGVIEGYRKKAMSKTWHQPAEKTKWVIITKQDPDGWNVFTVYCPLCGKIVIQYTDAQKLHPAAVEHCGLSDTFYIGNEIEK